MKQLFIFFSVIIMILTIVFNINGNDNKFTIVDDNYSSTQSIIQFFREINIAGQTMFPSISLQNEKELFALGHYFNNPLSSIEYSGDEYISLPEREAELFGLFSQDGTEDSFVYLFKVKEVSPDMWKIIDLTKMASFDVIKGINRDETNKEHRSCAYCINRQCLMEVIRKYLGAINTTSKLIAENKQIYLDQSLFDLISIAKHKEINFEIVFNYIIKNYAVVIVKINDIEKHKVNIESSNLLKSHQVLFELEKEKGLWKITNISN